MALKNFTQFTPYTTLSGTDYFVGYRDLDEIRTDLESLTIAVSGILINKGFTPGASVGTIRRISYRYTIGSNSPVNAVSGTDDFGLTLSYSLGQVEVYRNGAHLSESLDFVASNGTQIVSLSTLNLGDIVEVVSLSSTPLTEFFPISSLTLNNSESFRYTVATGNTIVPGATVITGVDDFGYVLTFVSPNIDVYLNGMHLVRDSDYTNYSNGNALTLGLPVADGDIVDVVTLSATNLVQIVGIDGYNGVTRILPGTNVTVSPDSGTGIVTVSSYTSLDDIQVPTWTDGGHVTGWATVQQYLSAVARTNVNPASAVYLEYFGNFNSSGTGAEFVGGVLAPNGKIYCVPHYYPGADTIARIIDTNNNSVTTYNPGIPSGLGYVGGVLAPNGKIYFAPYSNTLIRCIDPSNNTITTFGGDIISSVRSSAYLNLSYEGGVVAQNGYIYLTPFGARVYCKINPGNNTVTTFGSVNYGEDAFLSGVLAPNGKIYFAPLKSTIGILIDPNNNDAITTYGPFSFTPGYWGGILAPNGKIYFPPNSSTRVMVIDPLANGGTSVEFFGFGSFPLNTAISNFTGSCLGSDGKIYYVPYSSTIGFILDPDSRTFVTYGNFPGSGAYSGGLLAPNGKIYFIPTFATQGLAICRLQNNNFNNNICTSPLFNKY